MSNRLQARPPLTRGDLVEQTRLLGVETGSVLMVHCSLSSLGYVVGGADAVVSAMLDAVGREGTLVALTGWEHDSFGLEEWPERLQNAYRRDPPIFDPEISEAARDYGRLPERIRTWPGACHSSHPEARVSAIGARARWLTENQPWDHPYGADSPLAKLVGSDGWVLMLGAPLETLTVLHHAEERANVPNKTEVRYSVPVGTDSGVEWREVRDIDTSNGALPYEKVVGDRDSFQVIGEEALGAGIGTTGTIGESASHLFPAKELVEFGVRWIEKHFA